MMNTATPASKRPRAPSGSGSSSSSLATSPGANPPHKASRIIPSTLKSSTLGESTKEANHPLLCNLPPTCHHQPTPIADTNELERHYATYHAHVCEVDRCGCVFTDARLLELHQTECHDPIAALRKDRGDKIFECHLPAPTCGRTFLTPKARRLHLIQTHGYPKEYFFAVTNKGIGGLLKRWGEGASLIRKEWKPREQAGVKDVPDMKSYRDDDHDKMDDDDDEDKDSDDDDESADLQATPRMLPRTTGIHSPQSLTSSKAQGNPQNQNHHHHANNEDNSGLAGLTNSLDSLSLVPNSIRFGRGGKSGGFISNSRGFRGRGRGRGGGPGGIIHVNTQMDVDAARPGNDAAGRRVNSGIPSELGHPDTDSNLGARGNGRGRIVPPRARGRGSGRGRGF